MIHGLLALGLLILSIPILGTAYHFATDFVLIGAGLIAIWFVLNLWQQHRRKRAEVEAAALQEWNEQRFQELLARRNGLPANIVTPRLDECLLRNDFIGALAEIERLEEGLHNQ